MRETITKFDSETAAMSFKTSLEANGADHVILETLFTMAPEAREYHGRKIFTGKLKYVVTGWAVRDQSGCWEPKPLADRLYDSAHGVSAIQMDGPYAGSLADEVVGF